jgi:hypothetical protein
MWWNCLRDGEERSPALTICFPHVRLAAFLFSVEIKSIQSVVMAAVCTRLILMGWSGTTDCSVTTYWRKLHLISPSPVHGFESLLRDLVSFLSSREPEQLILILETVYHRFLSYPSHSIIMNRNSSVSKSLFECRSRRFWSTSNVLNSLQTRNC